ncbi:hypothetical protein [Ramlibacter alkalitolerans]|uniref:HTH OST-type domain-containing protein n=1 Tax=Ramlibacter alkalitolerans TaxID=2039631 RepID=A0ABS1JWZ0_9BURK|nr:hypothetical protein [Ramlibacter alkalitolerans]MBL0428729.1 hypothetical protein [Ramlibacter alkalitolerans]
MANELAAVLGELERIEATLGELAARKAHLEGVRDSLTQVGAVMGIEQLQRFVPAVRVHRAYGGRGFLVDWLRGLLQAAAPHWVDTRSMVALAEQEFDLTFPTYIQRDAYRKNTLGRALRKLLSQDLVERQHNPESTSSPGLWRWKWQAPAVEQLRAAADQEAS